MVLLSDQNFLFLKNLEKSFFTFLTSTRTFNYSQCPHIHNYTEHSHNTCFYLPVSSWLQIGSFLVAVSSICAPDMRTLPFFKSRRSVSIFFWLLVWSCKFCHNPLQQYWRRYLWLKRQTLKKHVRISPPLWQWPPMESCSACLRFLVQKEFISFLFISLFINVLFWQTGTLSVHHL